MTTEPVAASGPCHPETTVTEGIRPHTLSFPNYRIPVDTRQFGDSAKGYLRPLPWDSRRPGWSRQPMANHLLSPSQNQGM